MWLSAEEALRRLGVKPQTLYANVSRGRIAARPDPADPRRSLYSRDDVDRLARKSAGRPRSTATAAESMEWGEPVLESSISTVAGGRLIYRGQDAADLSRTATLEDVAALLWGGFDAVSARSVAPATPGIPSALAMLACRVAIDPPTTISDPGSLRLRASSVLAEVAGAMMGPGEEPLHLRLAHHFKRPEASEDIRVALVLLADHELNASTFATRVAVSTGASFAAGTLAGLATLSGPLHGTAARAVGLLAEEFATETANPEEVLRDWLGEGRIVPGFGHRLYPRGDIRAATLVDRLTLTPAFERFREAGSSVLGDAPNTDFALAALRAVHGLPETAPFEIFALARTVGWVAHMMEQAQSAAQIRPRARYIGPVA